MVEDGAPARARVRPRHLDAQPLFSAGVAADPLLRPRLGQDGPVAFPNLHVAGDLLGGFDPARERTGLGVALVTGAVAAGHARAQAAS